MKTAKKEKEGLKVRKCLKCDKEFISAGFDNRLCNGCRIALDRSEFGGGVPMARWRVKRANG